MKKVYLSLILAFVFTLSSSLYGNQVYAEPDPASLTFKYQQGTKTIYAKPLQSITLETACDAVDRPMAYLQRLSGGSWITVGHAKIPCWMWEEYKVEFKSEYNNPIQEATYRFLFTTTDPSRNTNVIYKIKF